MSHRGEIFLYILQTIDRFRDQHGITAADIPQYDPAEVKEALEYYSNEGWIYSTVDEHHYRVAFNGDHTSHLIGAYFDQIKMLVDNEDETINDLIDVTCRACKRNRIK
jgi:hypothetical protein